jgi:hypothetical protein
VTDLSHPWEDEREKGPQVPVEDIVDFIPDFDEIVAEVKEKTPEPTSEIPFSNLDEIKTAITDAIQVRAQEAPYLPAAVRAELEKSPVFDNKRIRKFNEQIASDILKLRAMGWSVKRIEALEGMPNRSSIWEWRREFPAFGAAFEQMFLDYLDAEAEESIPIADNPSTSGGNVKRDKLRVETRLSVAGRRHPTRWGEQSTGNATTVIIQAAIFEKKADLQVDSNVKRIAK